ncbi:uncharacterized protein LOC113213179 [Frankliniella occidentalis]|uniref:Uncharacterized protein LOC113213179 n=1 Tax=Frankliniella occidentalis TaxID=133901 RepID=A0A6J1T3S7_FRAOC|nr:uncharacterized protein LOC113213179 [Frankliniella occidentalis]
MDDLPDDAVLAVLQHLDVSALLACRLVCRRLGGLVVHPDLWRHRRVSRKDPWLLPALQLAPCLGELEVEPARAGRGIVCYTATRCGAVTLRLTVSHYSSLPGAFLLNSQLALGRLKHLHLDLQVHFAKKGVFNASVLLAAVASSCGLQTLVVLVSEFPRPSWAPTASFIGDLGKLDIAPTVHPPSLRHFHCRLIPNLEPFINHILVAHAATLKVVELVNPDGSLRSPVTTTLLAAQPKLSSRESENVMGPLPDAEVLKVLQCLDVPDLLACRLVCRRLGGLALHPDAWRHRRLSHKDPWLRPALRLAPCLDELEVELALANPCRQEVLDYMTTTCAAAALRLAVKDCSSCYEVGALMVSKQVTLGRLKRLHIALDDLSRDGASVLLAAVASSTALETLVVSEIRCVYHVADALSGHHLSTTKVHPPSLRHLRCPLQPSLVYFINHMLNAHAETLETVDLLHPNRRTLNWGYTMVTARMMAVPLNPGLECVILGGMPHLRKLECCLLPGLQAAAECTSLREVTLWVSEQMRDHAADAEEFLARASQLRSVSLTYRRRSSGRRESAGIGAGLILALTRQPARSQLESLVADNDGDLDDSQLRPFLDALPSLPALRHLEMNGVLHGVLPDRVSPDRTPALRTLRLLPAMGRAPNCVHGYVHSPALSALLDNNPALEVHVCAPYYCETTAKPCSWCAMACHRRELPEAVWETPNKWPYAKLPGHLWVNVTRFVQHLKRKFPQ